MGHDLEKVKRNSVGRVQFSWVGRDRAGWQGLLLFAAGWVGVGLTHAAEGASHDPTSRAAVLWTGCLALFALAAIAGGAAIAVTAALSPMRRVFRSGPAFRTAAVLLALAGLATFEVIRSAPFDGMLAHGMPLAELITVLTLIAAAATCLVAGTIALRGSRDASRNERRWRCADTLRGPFGSVT
jgi:hypothetical protein